MTLREQLQGLNADERARLKARAVISSLTLGIKKHKDLDIDILEATEIDKGVQVLARVHRNGKQLGFGKEKDVDIERFKFFDPPYKVDDGTFREVVDITGETILVPNRKEDPAQALIEVLAHTISVTGEESNTVVAGKVGNTVSTFNPDADAESTSVDGFTEYVAIHPVTWTTARTATAGTTSGDNNGLSYGGGQCNGYAGPDYELDRAFFLFDTSALPDTDDISSAVFSVYDGTNGNTNANSVTYHVVSSTPSSNTAIVVGDHDQVGSTSFGSKALSTFSNNSFSDFTLDAAGIATISKTGVTKFALRCSRDIDDSAPTGINRFDVTYADSASNDPKLVVTHAAAAPTGNSHNNLLLLGVS